MVLRRGVCSCLIVAFGLLLSAESANAAFDCQFYKKRVEYDDQGNPHTKWDPQGGHLHTDGHDSALPDGIRCFGVCPPDSGCVCDEDADNITKSNGPILRPTRYTAHDCGCDPVAPPNPDAIEAEEAEGQYISQ